jgi:hypothetical protein
MSKISKARSRVWHEVQEIIIAIVKGHQDQDKMSTQSGREEQGAPTTA